MSEYQVMPELTPEEYAELKADIELRGVMVPIEYDEYGNVLDGYHRLKICSELGIKEYPKVIRAGMTEAEKLTHARKLNMARRQLTQEQRRVLIREQIKATPERSDRQIAKALGVDHKTIGVQRREMESIGEIPQSTRQTKDGRTYPAIRKPPEPEQPNVESEKPEQADEIRPCQEPLQPETELQPTTNPDNSQHKPVTVFNPTRREMAAMKNPEVIERMQATGANAITAEKQLHREAKAERKSFELKDEMPEDMSLLWTGDVKTWDFGGLSEQVDAVITDPPYGREYIPLYSHLSRIAERVLKPGGSLIVMTGQSYLPEVMHEVGQHMTYHWSMSYLTPGGQSPQLFYKRVNTFWKPVLWYVKGEYTGDYVGDVLKSPVNANEKDYHEWGQSLGGMTEIIERLTNPGDVVLDPFLGGGTTGVAAVCKGRRFMGMDINVVNVEVSRQRIKEAYRECLK